MLWPIQSGRTRVITNSGIVGTTTPGTGVPSNATTLLEGAVTELISAANNNQDSWGIWVSISNTGGSANASEAKLDVLIGGATDDVLIENLICGYSSATKIGVNYFFPLHVPGGVRLAAQLASVRTSITSQVLVYLFGGVEPPFRVGRKVKTYGTAINGARGQAVTPTTNGGAASVTEMIASTAEDHFAFLPGFQPATDTTVNNGVANIGIGVGASTEDRIGTWWYERDSTEDCGGPFPSMPAFFNAPSGSRLTMLASNSGANDAAYDGHIYAVS